MEESITCKKCHTENEAGSVFCHNCGEKLGESCPNCHSTINEGDKFCQNCGYDLSSRVVTPTIQPTSPVVNEPVKKVPLEPKHETKVNVFDYIQRWVVVGIVMVVVAIGVEVVMSYDPLDVSSKLQALVSSDDDSSSQSSNNSQDNSSQDNRGNNSRDNSDYYNDNSNSDSNNNSSSSDDNDYVYNTNSQQSLGQTSGAVYQIFTA